MRKELRDELVGDFERITSEVKESSQEMVNQITGGDSFPESKIKIWEGRGKGSWIVCCKGKYPLYDLHSGLEDISGILDEDYTTYREAISSNRVGSREKISLEEGEAYKFIITSNARNGSFFQVILAKKVGRSLSYATKIYRSEDGRGYNQVYEEGLKNFNSFEIQKLGYENFEEYVLSESE